MLRASSDGYVMMRWVMLGMMVAASCAAADPGYLPMVGPPPLRFKPPAHASSVAPFVLPPLAVLEPRPALANELTSSTGPAPVGEPLKVAHDSVAADPLTEPSATDAAPANPTNASATAPADTGILAPQMFLKYFTGTGTNGAGVSIYSPVGFVPPLPATLPSSSAAFQTTPPAKP